MIIFDLDGTLALDHHRSHLLKGEEKQWEEYFSLCHLDTPNEPVIKILNSLYVLEPIAIWSGRSASVIDKTMEWLRTHHISWKLDHIKLRDADDRTQDDILKMRWLQELRNSGHNVTLAFEDRQRVVDAWRANGVTCLQVAPGAF